MASPSRISRLAAAAATAVSGGRLSAGGLRRLPHPRPLPEKALAADSSSWRRPLSLWWLLGGAAAAGAWAVDLRGSPSHCDYMLNDLDKNPTEVVVEGSHNEVPIELINELKAVCKDNITLDYDERHFHGTPQNSFHKAVNVPDLVVYPRSEEEVSEIVAMCNKYKVPIVPYGGATSIEGHTLSPFGGVCIDMSFMKGRE